MLWLARRIKINIKRNNILLFIKEIKTKFISIKYFRVNILNGFILYIWFTGFGMEALFLIVVAYTRNHIVVILALTLAVGFSGFAISGK